MYRDLRAAGIGYACHSLFPHTLFNCRHPHPSQPPHRCGDALGAGMAEGAGLRPTWAAGGARRDTFRRRRGRFGTGTAHTTTSAAFQACIKASLFHERREEDKPPTSCLQVVTRGPAGWRPSSLPTTLYCLRVLPVASRRLYQRRLPLSLIYLPYALSYSLSEREPQLLEQEKDALAPWRCLNLAPSFFAPTRITHARAAVCCRTRGLRTRLYQRRKVWDCAACTGTWRTVRWVARAAMGVCHKTFSALAGMSCRHVLPLQKGR